MGKKEMILEFMNDKSYVPMKLKEIAQVLMVPKEEQQELRNILNELEAEYKIRKNRKKEIILGAIYDKDKIAPAYINLENPKYIEIDNLYYGGLIVVNYYREQRDIL